MRGDESSSFHIVPQREGGFADDLRFGFSESIRCLGHHVETIRCSPYGERRPPAGLTMYAPGAKWMAFDEKNDRPSEALAG
jgi:hypothetical protein